MFCANLSQYDPQLDAVVRQVPVLLQDDTISAILKHLAEGHNQVRLEVQVPSHSCVVAMQWDSSCGAFESRIDGMPSGLIFFDELKGALGKPAPANFRTCSVCLCSELDIWRRGVIDLDRGEVTAYTATPDLSYLGACAYLTDTASIEGVVGLEEIGIDALYVDLEVSDAARGALKIVQSDMLRLRNELLSVAQPEASQEPQQSSPGMDSLRELMESIRDYADPSQANQVRPEKGLG